VAEGVAVGVDVGTGVVVGSGPEQDAMKIATKRRDSIEASRFSTPYYSVFRA
jgi:hypothetical protein